MALRPQVCVAPRDCHDGCYDLDFEDSQNLLARVEYNVSPLSGWHYIECPDICQDNIAHTVDGEHPTLEQAIAHAFSHTQ